MTQCTCPASGYCATHRRMMSEIRHRQCRDEPGYFEAFQIGAHDRPARGLGDTVKQITDATGLSQLAKLYEQITGHSCGCEGRRTRWNKWFRYREQIAVGVTTAPRAKVTLQSTVASLVTNHWEPQIFAEPGSDLTGLGQLTIHRNAERLGAWRNWLHCCRTLLESTKSDLILTVQDDTVIAPGTGEFLRSIRWPADCGMVSLYTPTQYTKHSPGLHRIRARSLWGACAMLFRRQQLRQLLETKVARTWQGANFRTRTRPRLPHEIANVDTAIGKMLTARGLYPYFFTPSLSQHIGAASSIGHTGLGPQRRAKEVITDWTVLTARPGQSIVTK